MLYSSTNYFGSMYNKLDLLMGIVRARAAAPPHARAQLTVVAVSLHISAVSEEGKVNWGSKTEFPIGAQYVQRQRSVALLWAVRLLDVRGRRTGAGRRHGSLPAGAWHI